VLDTTGQQLVEKYKSVAEASAGKLCRRLGGAEITRDDLLSAAYEALVSALNRWPVYCAEKGYDHTDHSYLLAYVKMRIDGALLDDLRSRDWLSRTQRRIVKQVDAAEQLGHANGSAITEAATVLGLPEADVRAAAAAGANKPAALDAPNILGEAHELPEPVQTEDQLAAKDILTATTSTIKAFSARKRLVLVLRQYYQLDFDQIAEVVHGVSVERAKELYQQAILAVHQAMLRAALTGG
jgi:RNA polymerase sigma factor FliA